MHLIDHLRTEVGLPMRAILNGVDNHQHAGWTVDQAKADAAREVGATVTACPAGTSGGITGWEITCPQGAEYLRPEAA